MAESGYFCGARKWKGKALTGQMHKVHLAAKLPGDEHPLTERETPMNEADFAENE